MRSRSGQPSLPRIRAHDLASIASSDGSISGGVDGFLDELDRAIAEEEVSASGVLTAETELSVGQVEGPSPPFGEGG